MIEVDNVVDNRVICRYCGENMATQLCDMPKHTVIQGIRRNYVQTCDNPMCPDCATRFRSFEICPDCIRELKVVLEP